MALKRISDNQSPCGECGKWNKGCRVGCKKWAEFEEKKKESYKIRKKQYEYLHGIYMDSQKKITHPKNDSTMALKSHKIRIK